MKRLVKCLFFVLLTIPGFSQITPIQHVVIVIKENHSFDSLFGTFAGVNGATSGIISSGAVIPLTRASDTPLNYGHTWQTFILAEHGGTMSYFDKTPKCLAPTYSCYSQYLQPDISTYWAYAQQYVLADNFFSSMNGPSYPNHQYFCLLYTSPSPRDGL